MRGSIVEVEDLQAILGYEHWGEVARALRKQGVHVFLGKSGRPWTTVELINQAGGLSLPVRDNNERMLTAADM